MRDAAAAIIREVGVETGGSNIQFAVDPATGRMIVIEMNPRVSRSSALASRGHRLPDREDCAALLACGECRSTKFRMILPRERLHVFEPTIDYVGGENSQMAI